ncbi:MAG: lysophospholipid acyltransferase family protein [Mariprofundaceae bacterium]|nr:lysophospholipid acyltransferase family protein [Mariprofundaceae bacterium]
MEFGIRLLFWSIRIIPVRLAGAIGAGIGRVTFSILSRHRNNTIRNLKRVYPDKTGSWHIRTARESFAELGRTMFELPHVYLRSEAFLRSRIETRGEDAFRTAMQQGKGVFLSACHHSNWEFGAISFSLLGYPSSLIYRPVKQSGVNRYLKQCRERFGARLFSRQDGLRWIPKTLKQGDSIGIMIDQHMSQGIEVPFLGHLANTTELPAPFIIRNQTPLFGVALMRIGHEFRFQLRFWPIPSPEMTGEREKDTLRVMSRINESFEAIIHERPELWLWVHRRWLILDEQEMDNRVADGKS